MKHLKLFNESLTQEQVDEVSDLFIEVADEFGLNESIDGRGSRPGDNGAWRISKLSQGYTQLFVQINMGDVDTYAFERSLAKYLTKIRKKYHHTRFLWGDECTYDFYKASRYMIQLELN